jgi:hypothetical protein
VITISARLASRAAAILTVVAAVLPASLAHAYVLRHTPSGLPVRWPTPRVTVELDPSLTAALPAATEAERAAAAGWVTSGDGVTIDVTAAASASSPAVDGRNVVYYIPGYPPAGEALAITLVSCDDATGEIIDADVVINGAYPFAVLSADARAPAGTPLVANEAATASGVIAPGAVASLAWLEPSRLTLPPFDLVHVLSHETGHVLGLEDTRDDGTDVMFLYSAPGDADRRAPTADDLAGIAALYDDAGTPKGGGCAIGTEPGADGTPWLGVILGGYFVFSGRRRRAHAVSGWRREGRWLRAATSASDAR